RRAARSRTATSGDGGTSRLGGAAANILGLVHVCTAGRLASDPYHGARHGLGLDRAVPGQRSYKRPGDEHAEQPGYALGRAALGPCTDEQRRPEDLDALELQPQRPAADQPRRAGDERGTGGSGGGARGMGHLLSATPTAARP